MFSRMLEFLSAPFRKVLNAPLKLLSAPGRLWGLPVALRVALAALLVCAAVSLGLLLTWKAIGKHEDKGAWFGIFAGLTVAIPISVYFAVRSWLESVDSLYPDIDEAWQAGLAELAAHRLSLEEIPLYLVLGPPNVTEVENLITASGLEVTIPCTPDGPAPLHWFASPEAVFIVCTDCCRLSRLAGSTPRPGKPAAPAGRIAATLAPGVPTAGGSLVVHQSDSFSEEPPAGSEADESSWGSPAPLPGYAAHPYRGTMVTAPNEDTPTRAPAAPRAPAASAAPVRLEIARALEASERLKYLCRLTEKARQPLCPINGLLLIAPFSLFVRGEEDCTSLQTCLREDLNCLSGALRMCCPAVVLTGGMQKEAGFLELMRRVGRDAAKNQRFGKGCSESGLWTTPSPEFVESIARHAYGAFEDFTYALFRERGGYDKVNNPQLYELLCKIRNQVGPRFVNVMANGFGRDPEPDLPRSMLLAGCYFGATGEKEDQQAFVKGVFDKLIEAQDHVEWTSSALDEDRRYQTVANLCYCLSGLLLAVIAYLTFVSLRSPSAGG